jgi:hypothetical protein
LGIYSREGGGKPKIDRSIRRGRGEWEGEEGASNQQDKEPMASNQRQPIKEWKCVKKKKK